MKFTKPVSWLKALTILSLICSFALTATAQNHYPAEVGNTWALNTADGTEQRRYTIGGPEDYNGLEVRRLTIETEALGTSVIVEDYYFITVDDTGLTMHQSVTDEGTFGIAIVIYEPPIPFFPSMPTLGQQWQIVGETELLLIGAASNTTSAEVVAIEDVVTPAGTFEGCAKIELSSKITTALVTLRPTEYIWLAPDVGPIKFENDQEIVYELQSYNLVEPSAPEDAPAEDPVVAEEVDVPEEVSVVEKAPPTEETPTEETPTEEVPVEESIGAETLAEETPVEMPVSQMVEEPVAPIVPGFDVTLEPGLNMISIPLMPAEPYTAKSLAEMVGATIVIQLDAATQNFVGYTVADTDDGFSIDGGQGYIVNTPAGGMVKFTGGAWDNQPEPEEPAVEEAPAEEVAVEPAVEEVPAEEVAVEPAVEEPAAEEVAVEPAAEEAPAEEVAVEPAVEEAPAAPAISTFKSAWAFIVTSDVRGMETGTAYTLVAENLRTRTIATESITSDVRRSSAVWADLNRKSVIEAGDKLEIALYDQNGRVVSGPFQRTVSTVDIRNAFLSIELTVGDVQPQETILAQNFPNPFNPETWIPYQLNKATEVSVQIFDVSGRLVRTLDLGWQPVGTYMTPSSAAYWDGRNAVGERVASGIYFYTLQTSDFAATRRMVILK